MRKNFLIATLIGLCVIGITSCSKGEEDKTGGESQAQTTAMTTESQTVTGNEQAQVSAADTTTATGETIGQVTPELAPGPQAANNDQTAAPMDSQASTPMSSNDQSASTGTDQSGPAATDSTGNGTAPTATDNSIAPAQ